MLPERDTDQQPTPEAQPTLREALTSAMAASNSGDEGQAAAPPAGVQAPATIPDPAQQTAAQSAERARDEQGRFAKAPDGAQTPPPETNQAGPEALAPIRPPASWSAAAKADFATLAPHIQKEVLRREGEIEEGLAQRHRQIGRLNRLDEILAPRQERFQLAGLDEVQAVRALFAAQDLLERDPVNALLYLARQSGVDLRQLLGAAVGQQPQQAQLPPEFQQLAGQVQTLSQSFAQQQATAQQQQIAPYVQQVEAFFADPKNLYAQNVEEAMMNLFRSGQAKTLQEAYDAACWQRPDIRPHMLKAQADQAAAAARAKANEARQAGGSVIGSPQPGASPLNGGPAPSLRDELVRAWNA